MKTSSGPALRLLSIPLIVGLLTSCGQQSAPARQTVAKIPKDEVDEVEALVAATKQHPSMINVQKDAGPPIHVDPYPHSRGAPPHPMHSAK